MVANHDESMAGDINLDAKTSLKLEEVINEKAKEGWRQSLINLSRVDPKAIELERFAQSEGVKLFRGTSLCDVLYAILERSGKLISPLSYSYYEPITEDSMGTILTDRLAEAVMMANTQLSDSDVLLKKKEWMSSTTGLSVEELKEIGGLWQPILLEITNNIPPLSIENHYAEIWTVRPINLFEGAISEKTMRELKDVYGIDILKNQREPSETLSEWEVSEAISESDRKNTELWEQAIPDEALYGSN